MLPQKSSDQLMNHKLKTKSHPSTSNDDCEADRNYENKTVQTDKNSSDARQVNGYLEGRTEDRDTAMVDVDKIRIVPKSKVYSGLLFIESLRNVKDQVPAEYFVTYEGFWNECQESTEASVDYVFNYLKVRYKILKLLSFNYVTLYHSISNSRSFATIYSSKEFKTIIWS